MFSAKMIRISVAPSPRSSPTTRPSLFESNWVISRLDTRVTCVHANAIFPRSFSFPLLQFIEERDRSTLVPITLPLLPIRGGGKFAGILYCVENRRAENLTKAKGESSKICKNGWISRVASHSSAPRNITYAFVETLAVSIRYQRSPSSNASTVIKWNQIK